MYRFLLPGLARFDQGIVVFADVQAEEVLRREILVTFGAPVRMDLGVVYLEIFKGAEGEGLGVRR